MAITIEGCDRILSTAQETGSKLYVGHNMRHMAFVLKMKQLIDDQAIGEVKTAWCRHFIAYGGDAYFKDWHAERQKTTGLLLQKACHDIDVLHWLCGGYSVRVNAMGRLVLYDRIQNRRSPDEPATADWHEQNWPPLSQEGLNPIIDVEDINMLQAELDNDILISYQQCHFTPDAWRNYTIVGTEGRIENIGEERIRLWRRRQDTYWPGDENFETPKTSGGHSGADPRIVREFIDHVREDALTSISPIAARMSVATAYTATMSLRNGGIPMAVPTILNE